MEADEADMTDAVDRVAGLGAEKKRELFEALKSAAKKPRFRSPGPGGRPNAGATAGFAFAHPQASWEGSGEAEGDRDNL
eukprot:2152063-Pyramimonas_sp.AAC.1